MRSCFLSLLILFSCVQQGFPERAVPMGSFPEVHSGLSVLLVSEPGRFFGDSLAWALFTALRGWWTGSMAVCLGIGLQIEVSRLLEAGAKTLSVGFVACCGVRSLSGVLVNMSAAMMLWQSALGYLPFASLLFYFQSHREDRIADLRRSKLETASRLSIREAIECLEYLEEKKQLVPESIASVLGRLSPVIGEIQPLRTVPLSPGVPYRRLTYWKSRTGNGSLVGIAWPPSESAHIPPMGRSAGKMVEGASDNGFPSTG